ncbi:hypothetical protein M2139_000716 [Enterococcus sp. PF1-24]|uniref:hypothetical protein n=1 Tax=unclassified Enterococcus TaxID=2608891 RepID=UPI0024739A77|nr:MULTISPECIES: hypothetical protein [unclassified Enterococcus]MDH6363599.1 hypothetical protein [Enterococcus sp. PFB1-1]MDH6400834.1 hypothetical protein [Enterococcus sp. PF1-24]
MSQVLKIYLKQLRFHFLIILVIVAAQLAISHMNQLFLNSNTPPTALEVYVQEPSKASQQLINKLQEKNQVTIQQVKTLDLTDLKTENIQGILIIPATFAEDLLTDKEKIIELQLAPGIQDATAIKELISTNLIQLKAEQLLSENLEKQALTVKKSQIAPELLINIDYVDQVHGSLNKQKLPLSISSVLFLVVVLYGISFIPSLENRRLQMYSLKNLVKCQALAVFSLLILWLTALSLFLLGANFFLQADYGVNQLLLLLALLFYTFSLSWFIVNLGGQKIASFLFIPWLLLNMTLGGGLWNMPTSQTWLQPFLPVALVLTQKLSTLIFLGSLFLIGNCGLLMVKKNRKL